MKLDPIQFENRIERRHHLWHPITLAIVALWSVPLSIMVSPSPAAALPQAAALTALCCVLALAIAPINARLLKRKHLILASTIHLLAGWLAIYIFVVLPYPLAWPPLAPFLATIFLMPLTSIVLETALPNAESIDRLVCMKCSYNLRGLTHNTCPECGARIDRTTLEIIAKQSR